MIYLYIIIGIKCSFYLSLPYRIGFLVLHLHTKEPSHAKYTIQTISFLPFFLEFRTLVQTVSPPPGPSLLLPSTLQPGVRPSWNGSNTKNGNRWNKDWYLRFVRFDTLDRQNGK